MVKGSKIEEIAISYCKSKGYKKYSYLQFCKDFDLQYQEWTDFKNDKRNSTKSISFFLENFPKLNMNWLLKDEGEMFTDNTNSVLESSSSEQLKIKQEFQFLQEKMNQLGEKINFV